MLRAIILDDEPHIIDLHRHLLEQTGDIEVVATFSQSSQAIKEIPALQPDLCFVDIQMPGVNGLRFAEMLRRSDCATEVVFITAYDEFALQAFELQAVDYLLKPLSTNQIERCLHKWRRFKQTPTPPKHLRKKLCAFGRLRLIHETGKAIQLKWITAKAEELFSYLLLHAERKVTRDELLESLWPNRNGVENSNVHTTVHRVKRTLREVGLDNILTFHGGGYKLDTSAIDIDLNQFEEALSTKDERVLELYQGSLFGDRDYPWAEAKKIFFQRKYVTLAMQLATRYVEGNHFYIAEERLLSTLQYVPYEEVAYEMLLKCAVERRDRAAFHQYFARFQQMWEQELGLSIKPEWHHMHEQMLNVPDDKE